MIIKKTVKFIRVITLAVIGLFGVLAVYSAVGVWRSEKLFPPLGGFVEVEDVRLHYIDKGAGQAIVLIHGASSTLRDFTASIFWPLARTHRVIAFDRPGYGYSQRTPGEWPNPAAQARLIRRALERIGVTDPVIVGHSWSGSVVLAYLLANPDSVAGGVLLAGGSHPWEGGVDWVNHAAGWPVFGDLLANSLVYPLGQLLLDQAIASVFAPNPVPEGYKKRAAVYLALRPETFRANAEDLRELSDFLRRQSERYDEIKQPLLLITGDADGVVPAWNHADRLVKQTTHAELVVLENTGHAPHHTHPERITALIDGFARRVGQAAEFSPQIGTREGF